VSLLLILLPIAWLAIALFALALCRVASIGDALVTGEPPVRDQPREPQTVRGDPKLERLRRSTEPSAGRSGQQRGALPFASLGGREDIPLVLAPRTSAGPQARASTGRDHVSSMRER
jgi:hypothetical protein